MNAMHMRMPFTFIVEADGPIRAADLVMESQHMEVVNVEPLLGSGSV